MSLRAMRRWLCGALLGLVAVSPVVSPVRGYAQEELTRKVKNKVTPVYPEIARRMSITGTVRLAVVVSPGGALKSTKVVGGHPLLVNAAMDALKRWKFEPAAEESSGVVEFKFQPQE